MTDQEFAALQAKIAEHKQLKAQAEGAAAEMLRQIKDEFGVGTLEEAEALAKKLDRKANRLKDESDQELARVKKKWKDQL